LGGEFFQSLEGAAGGQAGLFEEGRIEDKATAINERMIGGFEGLARAARTGGASDNVFVHFQIRLKIEGVADVPALVAGEAREKFLAKGGGLLPGHGFGFAVVFGGHSPGNDFEGAGYDGKKGFALEKIQEIAIEHGVNLQAVAAVFNDIGIYEVGDDALAEERFTEALG
jgi:hypothetical protein